MAAPSPWWEALAARSGGRPGRAGSVLTITVVVVAVLMAMSVTEPWRLIQARSFDYFSTQYPPPLPPEAPVIVAIDEPSLAEIGRQWPWPRHLHARLIKSLREAGARTIALDIIFAEPSNAGSDAALRAALGPDVVLAGDETFIDTPQGAQFIRVEPLPEFMATGARVGIASISLDRDGALRRIPAYPDGFAASIIAASGSAPAAPRSDLLLQAFGPARTYPTVSYYQALDPATFLPEGFFRGRDVIVGLSLQNAPTTDAGGSDAYATPFTVRTGRLVSGAEIQATIHDNLAHGLFIAPAPAVLSLASIVVGALFGAFAVWRGTGWRTLAASLGVAMALTAASYVALRFGRVFLPSIAPSLAFALVAAAQGARDYAAERRLRKGVTRAFSHYLSPVLVDRLARDPTRLKLGGEKRTLSILFCDVRGFTTISETLKDDPERLTSLVNRLLTPLSQAILANGGTIDKYIGDCIMAFWNAPLDDPDHAVHAVDAALAMLEALDRLNAELVAEARAQALIPVTFRVGVGINTGECVVGNLGSDLRFDYSALGDAVNLASRLEAKTRDYDVPLLLGPETARLVSGRYDIVHVDRIAVKGKSEIIPVSTVRTGLAGSTFAKAEKAAS